MHSIRLSMYGRTTTSMLGCTFLRPDVVPKAIRVTPSLSTIRAHQQLATSSEPIPTCHVPSDEYWRKIPRWSSTTKDQFSDPIWQRQNEVNSYMIRQVILETVRSMMPGPEQNGGWITSQELLEDISSGLDKAPMTIRIPAHIFSVIDWNDPLNCPIFRQFIPARSRMIEDHPALKMDSLDEQKDSPTEGLIHRYPHKVLLFTTSMCPISCTFCTRSYAVGAHTNALRKTPPSAGRKQRQAWIEYLWNHKEIDDVVLSGGDTISLAADTLKSLAEEILDINHIKHLRIASKGLAVVPTRLGDPDDEWTRCLIEIANKGRKMRKDVALHTHFNHPREITWITKDAADFLYDNQVRIRNQTVLLKGVNDNFSTMSALLSTLSDLNIESLYVYQHDMIKGLEHLRTPLQTAIELEKRIRGTVSGHRMPHFVIDLPGGGGKRCIHSYETYDHQSGKSTWQGIKRGRLFEYHDPKSSLETRDVRSLQQVNAAFN